MRNDPSSSQTQAPLDHHAMLAIALAQAHTSLAQGGIPIGAAIFDRQGVCLSTGHNQRVQHDDPSAHAETDAFRRAGRQPSYRELILVSTLAPCWYCSGLVRQFGFPTVIVGESENFAGGIEWLRSLGVTVLDLASPACISMMRTYISTHPALWHEDIGA